MAKNQGPKVSKRFTKIYYLLLVPVVTVGFMITSWAISANQTAIAIKSFPEFLPDEQSVIQEGMELSAENYLPLATVEVECGQKLDLAALPETVKAEILAAPNGEEAEEIPAAELAEITAEWDAAALDINTPGLYKLNLKLPGDYTYEGVLPYIVVQVNQAVSQPEDDEEAAEAKGEQVESNTAQPTPDASDDVAVSAQAEERETAASPAATKPCQHKEGCAVKCDDQNNCQHVCDENCTQPSKEIQQFCGLYPSGSVSARFDVEKGDKQAFTAERNITAYMTDGNLVDIPIKWVGSYNLDVPGAYRITMQIKGDYIWNGPAMVAEILVYDSESGR